MKKTRVFGLTGPSGSGKTTLLTRLIPWMRCRGVSISTVKHAHHGFELDRPGKDSFRHREAGAQEVLISSGRRWALLHELRDAPEPTLRALLPQLSPVDLILVEGFKSNPHPKLALWRAECRQPPLDLNDASIVGLASDDPWPGDASLPWLRLDDIEAIGRFVLERAEGIFSEGVIGFGS